jgi:HD-GYP domain-containing protein (c-di-GMP phosphodiesterase class II)
MKRASRSSRPNHVPKPAFNSLERGGKRLSERYLGLVENSIAIAPERLHRTMFKNNMRETWKMPPVGPEDKDRELYGSMMKGRCRVLALMHSEFHGLTRTLEWDRETRVAAADVLLPLLDLTERQCFAYYGHGFRTMGYAKRLLYQLGTDGTDKAVILLGALMHDVGKTALPENAEGEHILSKIGPVGDKERDILAEHSEYGYDILVNAFRSLEERGFGVKAEGMRIAEIAYQHHEHYDGTGRPRRLRDDEISLGARIAAFCDTFDTVTSVRPYNRVPLGLNRAMRECLAHQDTRFGDGIAQMFSLAIDNAVRKFLHIMDAACGRD